MEVVAGIRGSQGDGPAAAGLGVAQDLQGAGRLSTAMVLGARRRGGGGPGRFGGTGGSGELGDGGWWGDGLGPRSGEAGYGHVGGQVGQGGQLGHRDEAAAPQAAGGEGCGGAAEPMAVEVVAPGVDGERGGHRVGPAPQGGFGAGAGLVGRDRVADGDRPARLGSLVQDGRHIGRSGRVDLGPLRSRPPPAGGDEVEEPPGAVSWPAVAPVDGCSGQGAKAPAGDRSGQDLHAGLLVLAEPGEGAEEWAERVDPMVGLQGVVVAGGQAQLAAGRQRCFW